MSTDNSNMQFTTQNGGKFVGQGSYACVFYPLIKCNNADYDKTKYPKTVGKVFKENKLSHVEDEYHIVKKIKKIDPKNEFSVEFFGKCEVSTLNFKKSDEKDKCNDLYLNNYQQLIYAYKGVDLTRLPKNIKIENIFIALKKIMYAINVLNYKNSIIHVDIKPLNMLYNKEDNKIYLIDFGMSIEKKKFMKKYESFLLDHAYPYYPPEFQLYHGFSTYGSQLTYKFFIDIYERKIDFIELENTFTKYGFINYNNYCLSNLKKIYNIYKKTYKKYKHEGIKKLFYKTLNKVDIYSLGISMLELIDKYPNMDEDKKKNIVIFVSKITNFNPFDRLSGQEALNEYNKII